jgi:choline dehydrogenase-like flavoprotein
MTRTGFDAIVIGSGFGGAITACRLSEHGMKVLVLERGRRWTPRILQARHGGTSRRGRRRLARVQQRRGRSAPRAVRERVAR